jgi:predicted  nucleic acid-binding Zn-ribbon protein
MATRILTACPECWTQFGFESQQTQALDERIAALEAERDALKRRADAAEGLAGALEESRIKIESRAINLEENDSFLLSEEYYDLVKRIDAALAAYKQAQGKGG